MSRRRSMIVPACLVMVLLGLLIQPLPAHAQGKVQLLVWDQFTGPESDTVNDIYKKFNDVNPNVEIKRESYESDQMRTTINTALSSGTGPDVVFYDAGPGYAGVLANAGLLQPLDQYAAQYGWNNLIIPSALQGSTLNGHLYGMPLQIDLIGLYYNKTIFDKEGFAAPQTVDQLLSLCSQAKDKGYTPIAFGNSPGWEAFHPFSMLANDMIGPDALGNLLLHNQGTWDSPQMVSAIKTYFVDMKNAGCFNDDPNALSYDDANSLFYNEQAVMTATGSWLSGDLKQNIPDDDIQFIPFPTPTGAVGQYWSSGVGSAYFISAKTQHANEAAQFINYLFSPDVAKRWVSEANFFLPMAVDTTGLDLSPLTQSILSVLSSAASGQTTLGYNVDVLAPAAFNDTLQNGLQAILAGQMTPEQLATSLQQTWQQSQTVATPVT